MFLKWNGMHSLAVKKHGLIGGDAFSHILDSVCVWGGLTKTMCRPPKNGMIFRSKSAPNNCGSTFTYSPQSMFIMMAC